MRPYNPPLEGRRAYIRLDFNENSQGCSPKVIDALKQIDRHTIAAYPEYNAFRKKLAEFMGLSSSRILPTNASDEGIMTVFQTFLDARNRIVLPVPTFAMFTFYAQVLDLEIVEVLYNPDLSFPVEQTLMALTPDTKAVVLVSPNNPTGTSIPRNAIIAIAEKMKDRLVLLDEAYYEFNKTTAADLIEKYRNLIILRTFSKAFGMAGLRLGIIISCEENIAAMAKAHSPYSISALTATLAMAALDDPDYAFAYAEQVRANKAVLQKELTAMGIKSLASDANFILARFNDKCKAIEQGLKENGILVRDRSSDPLLQGCLRITVGTSEQTEKLIKSLRRQLKN
ncbi:MAG: histidinol-phosphate transaminase [Candidatus Raymondbacteria bacterium RifOxyA12_full_50_37]|uniref:Histidinol-phosphate transaminase n=1 Tax=Candidatus Raymondbacteria bacterium RIFOXYD12_FULL_49_13 TaxID=1817890 RepID=A0A1F7F8J3_UNCRA|nr:MAG: histidinol-phosphate transaminase [Candidatus Raymondbacteria bacterium RifOxyA12_full_50_37]OGJ86757.1 MAG: histidinol-phosphate transaminase [Candidatus Raymondbacteria bacterium RIFOXYA2_FULL_49_16]OGK01555.1 MAG: histidinol-phosphate transaminase [Candidatus Raymondbacteria bacterium RifOxyB12_full_50_8]OGK02837.1 MAG: histidinol-phosphate transaminase [Candidatus Raymondbacteria bacterium RIFOXYD12_FULL_49_13]OGP40921.1 MAG: histidinol-phosphate transaminase [Candidatus Raymondbact